MAKITLEFDTESKEAVASIDGKTVPNFYYGSIYGAVGDMKGMCNIESRVKEDGMTRTECVYASEQNMGLSDRLKEILR